MKIFARWFLVVLASAMLVGQGLQGAGRQWRTTSGQTFGEYVDSYVANVHQCVNATNWQGLSSLGYLEWLTTFASEASFEEQREFALSMPARLTLISDLCSQKLNDQFHVFTTRFPGKASREDTDAEDFPRAAEGRRAELARMIEWGKWIARQDVASIAADSSIALSKMKSTLDRLVELDCDDYRITVTLAKELQMIEKYFQDKGTSEDGRHQGYVIDGMVDYLAQENPKPRSGWTLAWSADNKKNLRVTTVDSWLAATLKLFEAKPDQLRGDFSRAFVRFVAHVSSFNDSVKQRILEAAQGGKSFINGQFNDVQKEVYATALLVAGYNDLNFLEKIAPFVWDLRAPRVLGEALRFAFIKALLSLPYTTGSEVFKGRFYGLQVLGGIEQLHNLRFDLLTSCAQRESQAAAQAEQRRQEEARRQAEEETRRQWQNEMAQWQASIQSLSQRLQTFRQDLDRVFGAHGQNQDLWQRYASFDAAVKNLVSQQPFSLESYEQEILTLQAWLQQHEYGAVQAKQQALMDARERFRNYLEQVYQQVSSTISGTEVIDFGDGDFQIVQARQQAMRQEAHHISVDFWAEQGAFNTADIALFQEYYVTIGHTQQQIAQMIVDLNQELHRRYAERIEEARRAEEEARLEQDRQEQRRVQQERMRLEEEQRRQQEEAMRLAEERRQEEARLEAQRQENLRQIRAQIGVISRAKAIGSAWKRKAQNSITAKRVAEEARLKREEELRAEQEAAKRKEEARLRKQAADKERAEKLQKMKQGQAATKIQAQMRGFVARQKYGRALAEKRSEEEAIRQQETRRREELERKKQAEQAAAVAVQAKKAPVPAPRKPQSVPPVAENAPTLRHAETQQHAFGPTQAGWQGGKETAAADADAARLKKLEELRRQQVQQGTEGTRQVGDLERGLAGINADRDWSAEVLRTTNAADENQRRYVGVIVAVLRRIANLTGSKIQRYPQMNALANGAEFKKVVPLLTQTGRDLLRATVASEGIDLSFAREAQDKQKISAEELEKVLGMLSE